MENTSEGNIPLERPERLLVESLLQRKAAIEQAQAALESDIVSTQRYLEKSHGLDLGAIGAKYQLCLEGLIYLPQAARAASVDQHDGKAETTPPSQQE